ncbi:MAG: cofactor-independent phosphoglycerate mutase [Phycisphaerae bacterium]
MKYAIIIPDGAADLPMEELEGKTPLAAARTPHMDWIATHGKLGTVRNVPKGMSPGSDVAIMSLLGYDPREFYTGRAPLEAAAQGLKITDEWVFRCNFVTIVDSTEEATALLEELNHVLGGPHVHFYPGVSYRHLMTYRGEMDVKTTPPHDILGEVAAGHLPSGKGAEMLRNLVDRSQTILAGHEVNVVRRDLEENPATSIWLWGQGKMPTLPSFSERFGLRGASITAVDLVRGVSKLIGWDIVEVPGATGYLDTNYAGKGSYAIDTLKDKDLVFVHVEAPDEMGHAANLPGKIESIEQIDRHIVGPVLEHLQGTGEHWRILVLPDHPTPISIRTHTADPVPFAIAGEGVKAVVPAKFSEKDAAEADLHVDRGCDLMEYFLTVR